MFFFFFSSRRRHTRWPRDWSSDVCSSDLEGRIIQVHISEQDRDDRNACSQRINLSAPFFTSPLFRLFFTHRSEERRVGKEVRSRWTEDVDKNTKAST